MEITLTIKDVDDNNVEFDWHEMEALLRGIDEEGLEGTQITGALIVCLTMQRMLQSGIVQPLAMLACQDVLQKMRAQQELRNASGEVEMVEVDARPAGE